MHRPGWPAGHQLSGSGNLGKVGEGLGHLLLHRLHRFLGERHGKLRKLGGLALQRLGLLLEEALLQVHDLGRVANGEELAREGEAGIDVQLHEFHRLQLDVGHAVLVGIGGGVHQLDVAVGHFRDLLEGALRLVEGLLGEAGNLLGGLGHGFIGHFGLGLLGRHGGFSCWPGFASACLMRSI